MVEICSSYLFWKWQNTLPGLKDECPYMALSWLFFREDYENFPEKESYVLKFLMYLKLSVSHIYLMKSLTHYMSNGNHKFSPSPNSCIFLFSYKCDFPTVLQITILETGIASSFSLFLTPTTSQYPACLVEKLDGFSLQSFLGCSFHCAALTSYPSFHSKTTTRIPRWYACLQAHLL